MPPGERTGVREASRRRELEFSVHGSATCTQ